MKKIISILLLSVVAWSMMWADDDPLYTIVCKQNDRGIVTTSPVRQAHWNDVVKLTAVPYDGYKLDRYTILNLSDGTTVSCISNAYGTEHSFFMPQANVEVSANFVPADYIIYIDQKPEGTLVTNPSGKAQYGSIVTVTFTPNENLTDFNITNVTVDKVNSGGFSDDEPWGPARAPGLKSDNSVEVTQIGFNSFSFVMPASDVLVTPVFDLSPIKGDINGDGFIDSSDVSALLEIVLSDSDITPALLEIGDFNGDGFIDSSDVSAILEYVLVGD